METRAITEQAKGVLIGRHGYDANQAFEALTRLAQQCNRKQHDVARPLVASSSQEAEPSPA